MIDLSKLDDREKLIKEINSNLNYDFETGIFTWIMSKQGSNGINSIAGRIDSYGYIQLTVNRNSYLAHRIAWLLITGSWPKNEIDHKDLNKQNNKWENLREADDSQNGANRHIYKNNKSGIKGVYWDKSAKKWKAQIKHNNVVYNLGRFENILEAEKAYISAADNYHKEFART